MCAILNFQLFKFYYNNYKQYNKGRIILKKQYYQELFYCENLVKTILKCTSDNNQLHNQHTCINKML